jgi:hypothetical protein
MEPPRRPSFPIARLRLIERARGIPGTRAAHPYPRKQNTYVAERGGRVTRAAHVKQDAKAAHHTHSKKFDFSVAIKIGM